MYMCSMEEPRVLYKRLTHTVQKFYTHCTKVLHTLHKSFTHTAQKVNTHCTKG